MTTKRVLTREEEIVNSVSHAVGLGLAIAALVLLIVFAVLYGNIWHVVSFSIFGASLVILYLSSTLYHAFAGGKIKQIFRIIDHSAIFVLIAGTYTPITLTLLRDTVGWTIFAIVWGIALFGIVMKAFFIEKFEVLSVVLYVVMGWVIVVAVNPLLDSINTTSLVFLLLGGFLYMSGIVFYAWQKKYHHAVWHFFVIGGSVCHFFTILYILPK